MKGSKHTGNCRKTAQRDNDDAGAEVYLDDEQKKKTKSMIEKDALHLAPASTSRIFTVPVEKVLPAAPDFAVRESDQEWVKEIKNDLIEAPFRPVTIIPVLLYSHEARHASTACNERLLLQVLAKGVGMTVNEAMEVYREEMETILRYKHYKGQGAKLYFGLYQKEYKTTQHRREKTPK